MSDNRLDTTVSTIRLAELTDDEMDALYSYIDYSASCHVHDEAMTWDEFVETADECIPGDWNGREIEVDDEDYQELRGYAQDELADWVDICDDEDDEDEKGNFHCIRYDAVENGA